VKVITSVNTLQHGGLSLPGCMCEPSGPAYDFAGVPARGI